MEASPEPMARLHHHLAGMASLEGAIGQRIEEALDRHIPYPELRSLLEELRRQAGSRQRAVADRLASVAPDKSAPETGAATLPIESVLDSDAHPGSFELMALHALCSQAVMGYAVMMELAFRAADSVETLGSENTGDIAEAGMRSCATGAQEIARLLPFVVVDELDREGLECRCRCPACDLGICGCPSAFRRRLGMAWADAGAIEMVPGIRVVRPRGGSPAARRSPVG